MNLFDELVSEALKNQPQLSTLRHVVEKEILHHDILRTLNEYALLSNLVFIGGTCLRTCYGGERLSEDLDFTGGSDFSRDMLSSMAESLVRDLNQKYGLVVTVTEPTKDKKNVDTWKIKIQTRPKQHYLPAQRINIDICSVPSYQKKPMLLLNPYGIDLGTSGLVIQAQSREEIFADKCLAFALRPNRVKYRDLWDISWLHQNKIKPALELIPNKLADRKLSESFFVDRYCERLTQLKKEDKFQKEFENEMKRFLSSELFSKPEALTLRWNVSLALMEQLYEGIESLVR